MGLALGFKLVSRIQFLLISICFHKVGIYKTGISALNLYDGVSDSQEESRIIHFSHPTASYVMHTVMLLLTCCKDRAAST